MSDIRTLVDPGRASSKKEDDRHERHVCAAGVLKFSGLAAVDETGNPSVNYLADPGTTVLTSGTPTSYPLAVKREARNLAVNVVNYTVQTGGSIVIELRRNGVVLPEFTVTFLGGETGVKLTKAHKKFDEQDVLDLQVTTVGITDTDGVNLAATIGLEH